MNAAGFSASMKEDINKEFTFCHHFFSALVTFFSNPLKTKEKDRQTRRFAGR